MTENERTEQRRTTAGIMWQQHRKFCPEIVPLREHECTDGKWRSIYGMMIGVQFTGQSRPAGYAYRDARTGTTFGTRATTEQELRDRWQQGQDKDRAEFIAAVMAEKEEQWEHRLASWHTCKPSQVPA